MPIDMSQFLQTFYEESFEGLDIMENGLLNLNEGVPDSEMINSIFRAAHSIKGGSGTFGLDEVSSFTHVMETLLDQIRDGHRQINQGIIDTLLQSVDCLKEMLSALRDGGELNNERIKEIQQQLESLLNEDLSQELQPEATASTAGNGKLYGWIVKFYPHEDMLHTGNDVVRIIRELSSLGDMEVECDQSKLPAFQALDPENCYLGWNIKIKGNISEAQIREIFEWVEDECDLELIALQPETSIDASSQANNDVQQAAEKKTKKASVSTESSSIRVDTGKIDALINMVGELVITQSMLGQMGDMLEEGGVSNIEKLRDGLLALERNTRELQESVMRIRMLPISFAFNRFPRLVHDLNQKLNKKVELKLSGEQTELDKSVLEKIGDPLVHLVRNSLDHGIESPEARLEKGKPEAGTIHLNAYHQGGNIVIEINDDGAGLNKEKILAKAIKRGLVAENDHLSDDRIYDLIMQPGFSTAEAVSDVSGRGVGMDVVKRNIADLNGSLEVKSVEGEGSTFTIRLPLTLAILDGQLVRVGDQIYIIPLVSIIESLQAKAEHLNVIAGKAELYMLRKEYLPIIRLSDVFSVSASVDDLTEGLLVIVEGDGHKAGLFVDDLLAQQQVVIKSLETNFKRVEGLSGATILCDGTVALIVDVAGLVRLSRKKHLAATDQLNKDELDVA